MAEEQGRRAREAARPRTWAPAAPRAGDGGPLDAAYEAAADLYRDGLLPEDRYEEWTIPRRDELRAHFVALLQEQAAVLEARGDVEGAVGAAARLVAEDPLDESGHILLIRLNALAGRRSEALRRYEQLRDTLAAELGTEPSPEVQRLYEEIRTGHADEPELTAALWERVGELRIVAGDTAGAVKAYSLAIDAAGPSVRLHRQRAAQSARGGGAHRARRRRERDRLRPSAHASCLSTGSTERPSTLTPRRSNSGLSLGPRLRLRHRGHPGRPPQLPDHRGRRLRRLELYGMLPAAVDGDASVRTPADNQTVRNVFVVGPDKKVKRGRPRRIAPGDRRSGPCPSRRRHHARPAARPASPAVGRSTTLVSPSSSTTSSAQQGLRSALDRIRTSGLRFRSGPHARRFGGVELNLSVGVL